MFFLSTDEPCQTAHDGVEETHGQKLVVQGVRRTLRLRGVEATVSGPTARGIVRSELFNACYASRIMLGHMTPHSVDSSEATEE